MTSLSVRPTPREERPQLLAQNVRDSRGGVAIVLGDSADNGVHRSIEAIEQEGLLGREVVEDSRLRHTTLAGDLGDRHVVEATVEEEASRGIGEFLTLGAFLTSTQPLLGRRYATLLGRPDIGSHAQMLATLLVLL